ncbi:cytochrome c1 [Fontimonas sp. SYSU GA230001]|uniref:cytochrome c1 n=1 Tax=Fontimonas sp. SYSU GA230001 TaxID=3142450 RepID=UPI0032B43D3B
MTAARSLLLAGAALCASAAQAAGGAVLPYSFKPDTGNLASAQRGARNFMNYCSGCHSMAHLRYGRMAADLDIPEELLKKNLMFTTEKPGDHIVSSMPAESAGWFGARPPDLTLETRMRGADWVYNYLMTFYLDAGRPLGTNNLVLPGASMPHVLGELQGWQVRHEEAPAGEGGHGGAHAAPSFKIAVPGKLDAKEYQKFVADTVNFMVYAAEPGRADRVSTGIKVMLFLVLFTVLAYMLKREYWKDVH